MIEPTSTRRKSPVLFASRIGLLLLALSLPLLEHSDELLARGSCGARVGLAALLAQAGSQYQRLASAGYRKPRSHSVTVVVLKKGREPGELFANLCRQRLYVARLLTRIENAKPSGIVLDKYFSAPSESCIDENVNSILRNAVLASAVPIIIGLHTETVEALTREQNGKQTKAQGKAFEEACLCLMASLKFEEGGTTAGRLHYGLLRLNRDTRKLPLQWSTYVSYEDIGQKPPQVLPTLSLVAAREFDKTPAGRDRIERLINREAHPFTSFIPTDQIPVYSALDLLCGTGQSATVDWQTCLPSSADDEKIGGRIIAVGDDVPDRDQHDTPVGRVPGVLLQANYIESILDDRVLNPVPTAVAVIATLLWIGVIDWFFWRFSSPEIALALASILSAVLWFCCYILTAISGYFFPLWFPGLIFLLTRWALARGHSWSTRNG